MDVGKMAGHARVHANWLNKRNRVTPTTLKGTKMFLRQKLEEVNLHQLVRDKMAEMRCDFITLCRVAHIRQFQTDPDQTQSYINWVQHGLVPTFLEQWLNEQ